MNSYSSMGQSWSHLQFIDNYYYNSISAELHYVIPKTYSFFKHTNFFLGSGVVLGALVSTLFMGRRRWPIIAGMGMGIGLAYANCEFELNPKSKSTA